MSKITNGGLYFYFYSSFMLYSCTHMATLGVNSKG